MQCALDFCQRVETDANDERSDPAKELGMAMCLQPCGRKAAWFARVRDGDQVPDTEERTGQEHEEDASGNEGSRNMLAAALSRNSVRLYLFYQLILISNDFVHRPGTIFNPAPMPRFTNGMPGVAYRLQLTISYD